MSAEKGRPKLSRWQVRAPRLDVGRRVGWLDGYQLPPDKKQKTPWGVGQGSLGPRGFLSTNNSQCYCRGRAGACAGVDLGVGARVSVRVWAKRK